MKVLNVAVTLDPVEGGGVAERTYQMSRSLANKGIGTSILTLDLGLTPMRLQGLENVKLTVLPCLNKRFYIPWISPAKIIKAVQAADIIHIISHWTPLNAIAYSYARKLGKPYVVCPAGALLYYGRSQTLKRAFNKVVGRAIIRNASGHIAVTGSEISQFESYGVRPEEVIVIPNGVHPNESRKGDSKVFRAQFGLGEHPLILFLGRLNPIKGPDLLLDAFSRLASRFPDHHLVFAGPDNGMLHDLKRRSVNADLEKRVHFIGYVGDEMKQHCLQSSELVVIPSRHEAMSIVVLEAGMAAKPVLLTDQCGFDQIDSIGGGKVVSATIDGLEQGLQQLLPDPAKLKVMGEKLRRFAVENFTWDAIIPKYVELYSRILEGRRDTG